jgi:hypothetical protein
MNRSISTFSWNVRGLNDSVKCGDVLSELLFASHDIVLIQETKLSDIPLLKRLSFLPRRLDDHRFVPECLEQHLFYCIQFLLIELADRLGVDQAVNTLCESYLGPPGEPPMARTTRWRR